MRYFTVLVAALGAVASVSAQECGVGFGTDLAACEANCQGGECVNAGGTLRLLLECFC